MEGDIRKDRKTRGNQVTRVKGKKHLMDNFVIFKNPMLNKMFYLFLVFVIVAIFLNIIICIDCDRRPPPDHIRIEIDGEETHTMVDDGEEHIITVTVYNTEDRKMKDCTVTLEELGIPLTDFKNNDDGTYTAAVTPDLGPYSTGEIRITMKYTGDIPVTKTP